MSLIKHNNGWLQYGNGIKWRIIGPDFYCEVGKENHIPLFNDQATISKVKRVKQFYQSKLRLGIINQFGYGLDILIANSFTESGGRVPTPVSTSQLLKIYNDCPGNDDGIKLNAVISYLLSRSETKGLIRKEPGYVSPISTPGKISIGAHQSLISTALWLNGKKTPYKNADVIEFTTRLPAESIFAAQQAEIYFNKQFSKHLLQPPLLAACYNAGSIRSSSANQWGIVCHGNHIDRWVKYFNTSRSINNPNIKPNLFTNNIIPKTEVPPSFTDGKEFSSERILAAMKKKNYVVSESDALPYNLNIIGLRNPNGKLNVFDDKLILLWKYKGMWNQKIFSITTEPGSKFINSSQGGGSLLNQLGTAIIVPGQYINSHIIATHKGYPALKQYGKLKVYRDKNMNGKLDYDNNTIRESGPEAAINIHRANSSKTSIQVDSWSAGCQVFASPVEFEEFMKLCNKRAENFGKIFSYTLMLWNDL